MSALLGSLLTTLAPVLAKKALGALERYLDARVDREALRHVLEKAFLESARDIETETLRRQAEAILAEIRGESWLQRNWRPLVALTFAFIVVFYALLLPIAVDWFGLPPVRVGDTLLGWVMQAIMLALGGYIAGRSIEKVARIMKEK